MPERSGWAVEHQRTWEAALLTLREAGWQAQMTCLAAPVQLEGVLPCGERFYFRARHDEVLLAIGGTAPSGSPSWERSVRYGQAGAEEASYLPAQSGLQLLMDLSAQHDC